jgi:hypothetical protein
MNHAYDDRLLMHAGKLASTHLLCQCQCIATAEPIGLPPAGILARIKVSNMPACQLPSVVSQYQQVLLQLFGTTHVHTHVLCKACSNARACSMQQ